MTNEQAKSELMQIYMSLSEEKKKALDVAFKAMEQADNMPVMYYPQVDGITPTVVAQADREKTCGTCRNEDTYHCAECENKSDYEQAQADTIPREAVKDVSYDGGDNWWVKNMREQIKAQADGEYISRDAVLGLLADKVGYPYYTDISEAVAKLPSVAIPSAYKGMTNGEAIKAVFPNFHTDEMSHTVWVGYDAMSFHRDWWDSPYEPQERSEE